MAKLVSLIFLVTLLLALTSDTEATTYIVGDTSGWDISTDLDTWTQGKTFVVGDVLVFQYSSTQSLDEVNKQSYDKCNTTNVLNSFTNGNTTVTLTAPGPRYFISGNKLYCLSGMKLQVNVKGKQATSASAPQAASVATVTQPSSKSSNPSVISNSAVSGGGGRDYLVTAFLGFVAVLLLGVQI